METFFHKPLTCRNCNNIARMKILAEVDDSETLWEDTYQYERGTTYNLLKCDACGIVNIISDEWDELCFNPHEEINYTFLYPQDPKIPLGLPEKILTALKKANKIKPIDVDSYAVSLRKLLELVCKDKNIEGDTLPKKLEALVKKNQTPEKLIKISKGLTEFGNIGAHGSDIELTPKENEILESLSLALLEYIYSAPHLADLAEKKVIELNRQLKKG